MNPYINTFIPKFQIENRVYMYRLEIRIRKSDLQIDYRNYKLGIDF